MASCALLTPKEEVADSCERQGCEEPSAAQTSIPIAEPVPVQIPNKIDALEGLARTNPKAAYDLALRYFRGDGVVQSSQTSLKWMRQAGEQGQLEARKALGLLYLTGLSEIAANPAEAEKWLKIAASTGDKESAALAMEARRAKRAKQIKWKNEQYWRKNAQRYWSHDYPYFGRWENDRWLY
nr:sel1 repeat family protein [Limnobacter parvus]